MLLDRFWPYLYVVGACVFAATFSTGPGITDGTATEFLVVTFGVAAVALLLGTGPPPRRLWFFAGVALFQFGCMLRAWEVGLSTAPWQTRIAGPLVYTLTAAGLGLVALYSERISTYGWRD